jgi:hypothetical protein
MRRAGLRRSVSELIVVGCCAALGGSAYGASTIKPGRKLVPVRPHELKVATEAMQGIEFPTTVRTLIAKAQPDSCFVAPNDAGNTGTPPCGAGKVPKVNQGYAWSIVSTGNDVWWGTIANPLCQVLGAYLGITSPIETPSYVCEFPGGNPLGDTRPPQIWLYEGGSGTVSDVTPASLLVPLTAGMRAAGADDNVVLFAGPFLSPTGGVNMFAFDATTHAFLGATTVGGTPLPPLADYVVYTDIRAFLVVNGELYAGVKYELRDQFGGYAKGRGGKVLHWIGNSVTPFLFEEVGTLDTEAASMTFHEGRIFVSTWPAKIPGSLDPFPANTALAGVYMSPDLGADNKLNPADDPNWTKVWQIDDYEPDPLVAATTAEGAIASFDGYLFWGTMHVPLLAALVHLQNYGGYYATLDSTTTPTLGEALLAALLGTSRTTTIFRGHSFTTTPTVELAYGLPALPVFTYGAGPPPTGSWSVNANNMGGAVPMWGLPGFGNPFNNYLWSAQVHNGRLWMGTMDWSYLIYDGVQALIQFLAANNVPFDLSFLPQAVQNYLACLVNADETATIFGGDLYYFLAGDRPAFPESIAGVGNYTNYGVRSMTSAPSGLFLGMANPMNLLTDTTDDLPEGGWEVIRLVDKPTNTPAGNDVLVTLEDGTQVHYCEIDETGYTVGTWVPTPCCGFWLPVPDNYQTPQQMLLLGTSAALPTEGACSDPYPLSICLPNPGGSGARLYQPVLAYGSGFSWQDITTGYAPGLVCGDLQEGSQALLHSLGYNGYLGVVVRVDPNPQVPAASHWGLVLLAVLVLGLGVAILRGRPVS